MNLLYTLPIRKNGAEVEAAWLNTIRVILLLLFGKGVITQSSVAILDDQETALDVTGFVFDSTEVSSAILEYQITRDDKMQWGQARVFFNGTTWKIDPLQQHEDDAGLTLSITPSGQIQYVTDAYAAGTLTMKTLSTISVA